MRILHIIPYFYPAWAYGGTCRAAWEVARHVAKRGHEVIVHTTDALDANRRAHPGVETVEGVEIHRFRNVSNRLAWSRLFFPAGFGLHVAGALRRADVVHLHEYRSFQDAAALPFLVRYRVPFILTAQGSVPRLIGRFALKQVYDALVGRHLLQRAARLHALNTMEEIQFREVGGRPDQIFVSPNGIDVDEYRTLPPSDARAFRARYHIAPDAPVVLFLARINKIKGVDFLVSAFAEVCRAQPGAVLVIAGPDDGYLSVVKDQLHRLGIEDRVRFTGYLDGAAKLEAYQSADLYVLPSRYEMFAITLLESLACGTPIIATDRCGLADLVRHNGLGSVVAYDDVAGLAAELLRVVRAPAEARRGAGARRQFVLDNFGWDKIAAGWEQVYAECASEG